MFCLSASLGRFGLLTTVRRTKFFTLYPVSSKTSRSAASIIVSSLSINPPANPHLLPSIIFSDHFPRSILVPLRIITLTTACLKEFLLPFSKIQLIISIILPKSRFIGDFLKLGDQRDSNPCRELHKLSCCHYTMATMILLYHYSILRNTHLDSSRVANYKTMLP